MAEEDLIYGKNRHFFGGIEPSNMAGLTAKYEQVDGQNGIRVTWVLPSNTVINNQTLCTVAGCAIRKKENEAPKDEFDGELFIDSSLNDNKFDTDVEIDKTYVYRAFPYSTQGVYSRNQNNAVAAATAIAGYTPPAMSSFATSVAFVNNIPNVEITGSITKNIYNSENTVVDTVESVMIRRSSTSYPISETDGILISTITIPTSATSTYAFSYKDNSVQPGATYYYTAFPKSGTGLYNYDVVNRSVLTVDVGEPPEPPKYFNVKRSAILQQAVAIIDCDLPDRVESDVPVMVIIKRKVGSYPTSIDDGTLITTFTENDSAHWSGHHRFIDRSLTDGVAYYYRAFSKTERGALCTTFTSATDKNITAKKKWVFGFVGKSDGNIIYPEGFSSGSTILESFDNANYTPATMTYNQYGVGSFNSGSWDIEPGTLFMPKPCIINGEGTVLCYLNPNDMSQKEDCTPVDVVGEYMMEFPHMYITLENNYISSGGNQAGSFTISNVPNVSLGSGMLRHAYPFVKTFAKIMPSDAACNYFYMAIYPSVKGADGYFHSWPYHNAGGENILDYYQSRYGNDTTPTEDSIRALIKNGKTNDKRWDMMSLIDYLYIANLTILLFKSAHSRTSCGPGRSYTTSNYIRYNEDKKGMFYSDKTSSVSSGMKVFGIQDFYGGFYHCLSGYTFQKINMNDLIIGNNGDTRYSCDMVTLIGGCWENNTYSPQYYMDHRESTNVSILDIINGKLGCCFSPFANLTSNKLTVIDTDSLGLGYMGSYIDKTDLTNNPSGIAYTGPIFGLTGMLSFYIVKTGGKIHFPLETYLDNETSTTPSKRVHLAATLTGSSTTYQGDQVDSISSLVLGASYTKTWRPQGEERDEIWKSTDPFYLYIRSDVTNPGMFSLGVSKDFLIQNTVVRMIYRNVTVS